MPKWRGSFDVIGDGSPDPIRVGAQGSKNMLELLADVTIAKPLLVFLFCPNKR